MMQYNIKETKELLDFTFTFGKALAITFADGRVDLLEFRHFLGAIGKLQAAVDGVGLIPYELKDLDSKEKQELIKFVVDKFNIPMDDIHKDIDLALRAADNLLDFLKIFQKKA